VASWTPGEQAGKDPEDRPDRPWWQGAVIYQIYPRSFLDTDGDGVGDLAGIRRRLPYLARLGVDALWLSPFYPSPMRDFGYDVSDYCDVDPLFGTLDDARMLVAEAHEHGIRVVVDFVPNHTSSDHPWFLDARSSPQARHRDWYVWRDPVGSERPGPPPNPWMASFTPGQPAWSWDEHTAQWYLHLFLPEQPDLDWHNPEVVEAMHGVLRFWMDLGVDGFRIDVCHLIGKDVPTGLGAPAEPAPSPYTHEVLRDLRRLIDSYPGERMMVGEVYILSTARVAAFYGKGDELHLAFNFPPLYAPWEADAWRVRVNRVVEELDPIEAWPSWVLSNHDNPRHRTRYGSAARARAAALLLLGLRGTPFLYAGEELGLSDAIVPPERTVDPAKWRDGCRAPIPWQAGPAHGWATPDAWLPWPPEADSEHAAAQEDDAGSFLNLYRAALAARRGSPALRHGTFGWLESAPGTLVWERRAGDERVVAAVNFTDAPAALHGLGGLRVLVSSDAGVAVGEEVRVLPPAGAVWLG
jgi:alpha-glucosidase